MTRFDADDPTERRKLFADAVTAHRRRGSQFLTVEVDPVPELDRPEDAPPDGGGDDEPSAADAVAPWIQFAQQTFNMDCTDDELDRLKSLLGDYPEFRIDDLRRPDDAEGANVRVTARSDANRVADFVERTFREVYAREEGYRAWVVAV